MEPRPENTVPVKETGGIVSEPLVISLEADRDLAFSHMKPNVALAKVFPNDTPKGIHVERFRVDDSLSELVIVAFTLADGDRLTLCYIPMDVGDRGCGFWDEYAAASAEQVGGLCERLVEFRPSPYPAYRIGYLSDREITLRNKQDERFLWHSTCRLLASVRDRETGNILAGELPGVSEVIEKSPAFADFGTLVANIRHEELLNRALKMRAKEAKSQGW